MPLFLALLFILSACALPASNSVADDDTMQAQAQPTIIADNSEAGNFLASLFAVDADTAKAEGYIDQALAKNPTNSILLQQKLLMDIDQGDFDHAKAVAEQTLKQSPKEFFPSVVMVTEAAKEKNWQEALSKAQGLKHEDPRFQVTPILLKAWIYTGLEQKQNAYKTMKLVADKPWAQPLYNLHMGLIAAHFDDSKTYQPALNKAFALWPEQAVLGDMDQFLQTSDDKPLPTKTKGKKAAKEKNSVKFVPKKFDAQQGIALAYAHLSLFSLNFPEMRQLVSFYARQALYLQPSSPLYRAYLSEFYEKNGQFSLSYALLDAMEPSDPFYFIGQVKKANLLYRMGSRDAAIDEIHKLDAQNPLLPEPLLLLGDIYRNEKNYPEALSVYQQLIDRITVPATSHWVIYYGRGVTYERLGDWEKAEVDLLKALSLNPNQPDVLNYLGYTWIDQNIHIDDATKMIEDAVRQHPDNGYYIDSLAWAYYHNGRYDLSISLLEKALEFVPNDATISDHLGDAYWQSGRKTEAQYQWKKALDHDPDADQKAQLEKKLESGLMPLEKPAAEVSEDKDDDSSSED